MSLAFGHLVVLSVSLSAMHFLTAGIQGSTQVVYQIGTPVCSAGVGNLL